MATDVNGRESAEQTPERPGAPTDPQTRSGGLPGTHNGPSNGPAHVKLFHHLLYGWAASEPVANQLLDAHRAETLAGNADAAAERDCLAMAVMFALQWKPDAPMGLREGIEEILATMPAADAAADFFRPGRTYAYDASGFTAPELLTVFRVVATTIHPGTGKRTAFGWLRTAETEAWTPYSEPADEWPASWTDVTTAEEVAS